jgi:predicted nucleotidyltransferase
MSLILALKCYNYVMFNHERKALERVVMELKEELGDRLMKIVAFGSRVRGDFHGNSDLDVLVVIDRVTVDDEGRIVSAFVREELVSGVLFEPVVKSLESFEKERKHNTTFYRNIKREGEVFYDAEQRGKKDTLRV